MSDNNIQEFLKAGVHFGHPTSRWNPNFKPYIAMKKNGIHIIDLESTMRCLEKAGKEIFKLVNGGGNIFYIHEARKKPNGLGRQFENAKPTFEPKRIYSSEKSKL